jgi:hypothetical protein
MFIIAQIPFADFRALLPGKRGKLQSPNWSLEEPTGFIRGFGQVSTRNSSSLGLEGERSFANMNHAIRFPQEMKYHREGWPVILDIIPWFRRLYFDGMFSGRFEVGFMIQDFYEDMIFCDDDSAKIDPQEVAQQVFSTKVRVRSPDTSVVSTSFRNCVSALASAYVSATTSNSALAQYPVSETLDSCVQAGRPFLHIRVSSGRRIEVSRDRRYITGDRRLFLASAPNSEGRNDVLVQLSDEGSTNESARERTIRVIFSHLNSLAFTASKLAAAKDDFTATAKRAVLREAVSAMIHRLSQFKRIDDNKFEKELEASINVYSTAYKGRIDYLTDQLNELSADWQKPNTLETSWNYVKRLHDLVIKTAVEKSIEIASKSSGG